jgi:predicted dehydrogenase
MLPAYAMRFGIIGCGTVAQIMHIPYLVEITDAEPYALVDPAEDRVQKLAQRYNISRVYTEHEQLLANHADDLDAVAVLTPSHTHADIVVDTLEAGINTIVEKPIAVTRTDATRMVEAERQSDAMAMVAYMKRYDPSYEQATAVIDDLTQVDLITAYDVDPDHQRIINEVYDIVEGSPPKDLIEESVTKRQTDIEQAIETDDETLVEAYDFQLEHVCHDINALRGLFGEVKAIEHVDIFANGRYATAHLLYENDTRCILETGKSDRKQFEEFIRVDSPNATVTIDFSNPFIKNTPTELQINKGIEEFSEAVHTPTYDESFKREIEYFIDCINGDAEIRTSLSEARDDLAVIIDFFQTYCTEHSI